MDFPCSRVSSCASSSPCCSTRSAKRSRMRSRSAGVRPAQRRSTKARQADITARSTSAGLASAVVAIACPVAGSQTVNRFSLCAAQGRRRYTGHADGLKTAGRWQAALSVRWTYPSLFFADSAFSLCLVGGWRFFLCDIRLRRCDSRRNSVVCPRRNVPRVIVLSYTRHRALA